ncbi:MAG: efflux RND transporter periplasmic adaptor subunit [Acidisphaera sp.]|nr:efflux RND transporter periplasmic adaptor subunit [Acidisphaera sp.]
MSDRKAGLRGAGLAMLAVCLLALLGGGWLLLARSRADEPASQPAPTSVPVTAAEATRRDVPVNLTGIGNVQALNSVLVRARVDGTLDSLNFTEGQEVKQGDLLAVIDPRPYKATLDQAQAKKAQDEAQLENAKLDLARYTSLARSQFASRQSVDTQQAMVNQLAATVQGDDATIEAAALNLSFTHVTAPLDGRAGLRQVDPGNLIHATDTTGLVTITQLHPIAVVFTLPEQDLPQVEDGMRAGTLPVLAYDSRDRAKLAEGKLLTPDNTIDTTTGTFRLKAIFPNPDDRLWPGQFVTVRVQVATDHNVVTVPSQAVQRGQDGLFVFVVKPDSTVAVQPVEMPLDEDGTAVVAKGLSGGEQVVVNGQSRLSNGTRVSANGSAPVPSTPAPPSGT